MEFNHSLLASSISYAYYKTAAGIVLIASTEQGIYEASFIEYNSELNYSYPFKPIVNVSTIILKGTSFQIRVWQAVLKIPRGQTATYQEIAHAIGSPRAVRVVANAVAHNKIAYLIPCHRVIRKNGSLGGYKWGIERKKELLKEENVFL
jgi:O-6-methylguanine DNA methyltransferase